LQVPLRFVEDYHQDVSDGVPYRLGAMVMKIKNPKNPTKKVKVFVGGRSLLETYHRLVLCR
jgi:hypothetical protein